MNQLRKSQPSNEGARCAPGEGQADKSVLPAFVPFATLHVRLFEELPAHQDGNGKERKKAYEEEADRVSDGIEQVLRFSRHGRLSDRVDLFRGLIQDIALVMAGCFAGVLITLSSLASSGVLKL